MTTIMLGWADHGEAMTVGSEELNDRLGSLYEFEGDRTRTAGIPFYAAQDLGGFVPVRSCDQLERRA